MKNVWLTIKSRLPNAIIEVIGKWSLSAQTSLPNYPEIRFAGFIPELGKALQNKIMIVPVWVGSGIRTKILAAWSASCPVITTTVGAEGLPGRSGEHFIIADDAAVFANACIELSQNMDSKNRIAANGLELVQKHYSLNAVHKTRLDIYEKLLAAHRLPKS
jgi:glycosyltransferase involved in cell wall biosynthesis